MKITKKSGFILLLISLIITFTTVFALASNPSYPNSASSDSASPNSASPDSASPDSASPDSASPDSASPDSASPDSAPPESTSPESTSAESTSAESTSVESTSAESTSAESTSAESTSAESTSPESTSPESTSPESTSPESTSAESTSAESTSAESTSPESTSAESTMAESTSPESTSAESTSAESTSAESTSAESTSPESTFAESTSAESTSTDPAEEIKTILIGDSNLDGIVSIEDCTVIQRFLARIITLSEEQLASADADRNGIVSIGDVTLIQKMLAKLLPSSPDSTIDEARKSLNVRDFGAAGDGVTDDTEAFYNCICEAEGRQVVIPKGVYVVNSCEIDKRTEVSLKGVDAPVITRSIAPVSQTKPFLIRFNGADSVNISGIVFDAKRDSFTKKAVADKDIYGKPVENEIYDEWIDTACLYFYKGASNVYIKNCEFRNCSREGIVFAYGNYSNINVIRNTFDHTSACMWLTPGSKGSDSSFEHIYFVNNICNESRTMPVEFDNRSYNGKPSVIRDVKILNNSFDNIVKCAVKLANCDDVLIENNRYTFRDTLYEHGRMKSDSFIPSFVAVIANKDEGGNLCCSNMTISNNTGTAEIPIQLCSSKNTEVTVSQFEDITIENNSFSCRWAFLRADNTNNLTLTGNRCKLYNEKDIKFFEFIRGKNCVNTKETDNTYPSNFLYSIF